MSAAAVALAGLPAIVLPERTIFFSPRGGWNQAQLIDGYMREVSQYVINRDALLYRYDAIGRDIWGKEYQYYVEAKEPAIEQARLVIANMFQHEGLRAIRPDQSREFKLKLPTTTPVARYV